MDYVKTRIKIHLYPAILFTLFIALVSNILLKQNSAYHLQDILKGFPHALWFLGVLFMAETVYFCLYKVLNVNTLFIILITIPLGFFLATPGRVHLPYEIQAVPLALLFYTIGCYLGIYIKQMCCYKLKRWSIFLYLLLFTSPLYATFTHSVINMSEIDRLFPDFVIMFTECLGCIGVGKILERLKILSWFGRNSLVIMALHCLYIGIVCEYIQPYIDSKIIYKIIETAIVFFLSILSVFFVNKKVPWIIGK